MTYEESYMKCNSIEEIKSQVISDVSYALLFNKDRIKHIHEASEKVIKIKLHKKYEKEL